MLHGSRTYSGDAVIGVHQAIWSDQALWADQAIWADQALWADGVPIEGEE